MSITGEFTDIPNGLVAARLRGNKLGAPFVMKAKFTSTDKSCAVGEYRQYVSGEFRVNGRILPHRLCGEVFLQPDTLNMDGCGPSGQNPGPCTAYGFRACPQHQYDSFLPQRATGCTYEGFDEPGVTGGPGDVLEVDLGFKGELIDTKTGDVLASSTWTVKGKATVPKMILKTQLSQAACGEVAVSADLVLRGETGHWDVTVSMGRSGRVETKDTLGRPAIEVLDENGEALAELADADPRSYTVGGSLAQTDVHCYTLEDNGGVPKSIRVKLGDLQRLFELSEA